MECGISQQKNMVSLRGCLIAKLIYNSKDYGLWYLSRTSYWASKPTFTSPVGPALYSFGHLLVIIYH